MNRLGLHFKNQAFLLKKIRSAINNGTVVHENRRYNHVFTFKNKVLRSCYNGNFKINNMTFQRLASTGLYSSNEFMAEPLKHSEQLSEFAVEVLPKFSEPSFSEIGLGGESLWGLLQYGLEYLHVDCGLPWWGAVTVATFSLRILVLPLVISSRKHILKLHSHSGQIEKIQDKIKMANLQGDVYQSRLYELEFKKFMKDNNLSAFKQFYPPIIQGTIFYSFYKALSGMASAPIESLKTGGLFWFKDLTMPDPYFILPIYAGISFFLMLEFGTDAFKVKDINVTVLKAFFRVIPLGVILFTLHLNSLTLCFWVSNSMFSFLQMWIFKSETCGKILGTSRIKHSKDNPPF